MHPIKLHSATYPKNPDTEQVTTAAMSAFFLPNWSEAQPKR